MPGFVSVSYGIKKVLLPPPETGKFDKLLLEPTCGLYLSRKNQVHL